jgi:hypothetical protein
MNGFMKGYMNAPELIERLSTSGLSDQEWRMASVDIDLNHAKDLYLKGGARV